MKQDLEGCNWIIKEKDTEMKYINKEKEELLQKMLEARLEIVQQKQTIKQLQDGMERLVAEVQRINTADGSQTVRELRRQMESLPFDALDVS